MAQGELSEFDAGARKALLLLKDAVTQACQAESEMLTLMRLLEIEEDDSVRGSLGEALDKLDEGLTGALAALTVIAGRKALVDLMASELDEFEVGKGPRDVRDKPTPR